MKRLHNTQPVESFSGEAGDWQPPVQVFQFVRGLGFLEVKSGNWRLDTLEWLREEEINYLEGDR